jgi:phosphoenolpyruvate carboxykinase (GTP)
MISTNNPKVNAWIKETISLLNPQKVVWIDGSKEQYDKLCGELEADGIFKKVNPEFSPNSYWCTSNPNDVARVESRTFICSQKEEDSGPTNNWQDPELMRNKLYELMRSSMQGKTLYVIPYLMGTPASDFAKVGFELSDSAYVVVNMSIMARVGKVAIDYLEGHQGDFVKGIHATCKMDPEQRYIAHFPETLEVISVNTNYGGNALQAKKCFALRLASVQARNEGWLAEHMLILAITNPKNETRYFCAAFPSACGKTNLAMLIPPKEYLDQGWKVETLGDDIAWLRFGSDGSLYAVNPEFGFFGVAGGTSERTNPNALAAIKAGNCIFTNTAFNPETNEPWWDELTKVPPAKLIDWQNREWQNTSQERPDHPNGRFTCPITQCPVLNENWNNKNGVPISAIIFGGRRATTIPLIFESLNWQHGTYLAATMSSETTAAATGAIGKVRRDPMAMQPFIGYHAADYFAHWLNIGKKSGAILPKIFYVNWFRKDQNNKFLWPGFSENMRILEWIFARTANQLEVNNSALGHMPKLNDLNFQGLGLTQLQIEELFAVKNEEWQVELNLQLEFLKSFGNKLPNEFLVEFDALKERIAKYAS